MAGSRNFNKNIRGVRTCAVDEPKLKKTKDATTTFNKTRIYGTYKWKKLRTYILKHNPICEVCNNNLATECDHITPFSTGMTDRQKLQLGFDISNLQSICHECHSKKHNNKKNPQNEI
jgi:5-methylcytosine-specific restriction endonuclease McrA